MAATRGQQRGYEVSDVSPALVAAIAAGFALFLTATPFVIQLSFRHSSPDQATGPRGAMPPAPRLEADPVADGAAYRSREAAQLAGYGWVDRPAGIVRMPIDEAMRILAERGRAGWDR
jgi:hypothetical protein